MRPPQADGHRSFPLSFQPTPSLMQCPIFQHYRFYLLTSLWILQLLLQVSICISFGLPVFPNFGVLLYLITAFLLSVKKKLVKAAAGNPAVSLSSRVGGFDIEGEFYPFLPEGIEGKNTNIRKEEKMCCQVFILLLSQSQG